MSTPAVPRHQQVSSWLRSALREGTFAPGDRLPSEHELCARFGVSRVTVRRALHTLEAEGLVVRRQGLGTFAAPPKVPQGLVRLTDFAQDMERAGLTPSSRILRHDREPCPAPVAEVLGLEPDTPVVRLDRLRLGDGEPLALDHTWLPLFYGQLLEAHDLTHETIYGLLERVYDIPVLSGHYRIEGGVADAEVARALGLRRGRPLLVVERTSRTVGERVVYFQRRYYRADRVAFELELERKPGQPAGDGMPLRGFEPVFRRG